MAGNLTTNTLCIYHINFIQYVMSGDEGVELTENEIVWSWQLKKNFRFLT